MFFMFLDHLYFLFRRSTVEPSLPSASSSKGLHPALSLVGVRTTQTVQSDGWKCVTSENDSPWSRPVSLSPSSVKWSVLWRSFSLILFWSLHTLQGRYHCRILSIQLFSFWFSAPSLVVYPLHRLCYRCDLYSLGVSVRKPFDRRKCEINEGKWALITWHYIYSHCRTALGYMSCREKKTLKEQLFSQRIRRVNIPLCEYSIVPLM